MEIKLCELGELLGGRLVIKGEKFSLSTVIEPNLNIDSRIIKEGEIFVCIKGENSDGHDFADIACKKGAIGLITEKELNLEGNSYFQIVVNNTKDALKEIAKYILRKIKLVQICITGSAGKTTVKELIYSVLSTKLNVFKTFGNFNTPIGIPLSLARINNNAEYFVAELSASYPGEMDENLSIVTPDVGIITGIGESHLEFLGDVNGVFLEKAKLVKALGNEGFLLVNGDNYLSRCALNLAHAGYSYGIESLSNITATNIDVSEESTSFDVAINGKMIGKFNIRALGEHFTLNSLPAIYLGLHFGVSINEIREGLLKFRPLPGRGELINLRDGIKVLDDSYNANPFSFEVSIKAFEKLHKNNSILVMGDMLELGVSSIDLHKRIAKIAGNALFNKVLYIGKYAHYIKDALPPNVEFIQFDKTIQISEYLKEILKEGDAVLIKGSNAMNLGQVVEELKNL